MQLSAVNTMNKFIRLHLTERGLQGTQCKKEQDKEGTEHIVRTALSPELCWSCTPEVGGLEWGLRKWRCQLRDLRWGWSGAKCFAGKTGYIPGTLL